MLKTVVLNLTTFSKIENKKSESLTSKMKIIYDLAETRLDNVSCRPLNVRQKFTVYYNSAIVKQRYYNFAI